MHTQALLYYFCLFGQYCLAFNDLSSFIESEKIRRERKLNIFKAEQEHHLSQLIEIYDLNVANSDDLPLRIIEDHDTHVEFNGCLISLDPDHGLEPIVAFVQDSAVVVEDTVQVKRPRVFKSRGCEAIVTISGDGSLYAISSLQDEAEIVRIDQSTYMEFNASIIKEVDSSHVGLHSVEPPSELSSRRNLRHLQESIAHQNSEWIMESRELEGSCPSYRIIDVSIVIDSALCIFKGGADFAKADATQITALAGQIFEKFCVKLLIKDLIVYCDPANDPIKPMIEATKSTGNVCTDGNGLLFKFRNLVNSAKIAGDVVHLFYSENFIPNSEGKRLVGCAFINSACRTDGYNVGVNQMTYRNDATTQAALFAHEIGHGFNAEHVSTKPTTVMNEEICGCTEFSPESATAILTKLGTSNCISTEYPPPPTPRPTGRPTREPTRQPTREPTLPTDKPTREPTLPTDKPTRQPTLPTGRPTRRPTGGPTTRRPTGGPTSRRPTPAPTPKKKKD